MLLDFALVLLPAGSMKKPMHVTPAKQTRYTMLILKLAFAHLDLPTLTQLDYVFHVTLLQYGTPTP
jgi:hypothetical protein